MLLVVNVSQPRLANQWVFEQMGSSIVSGWRQIGSAIVAGLVRGHDVQEV